jgi:hypothetical protein
MAGETETTEAKDNPNKTPPSLLPNKNVRTIVRIPDNAIIKVSPNGFPPNKRKKGKRIKYHDGP